MTHAKKLMLSLSVFTMMTSSLWAAQPKFSFIPLSQNTSVSFFRIGTPITVQYRVTNNTLIKRTLTIKPISGVEQLPPSNTGDCSIPFTLASKSFCTLKLRISLPVIGGPVVCKTITGTNRPDPLLCSQPSQADLLNITVGRYIYIMNNGSVPASNGYVVKCTLNSTGGLDDCVKLTDPLFAHPHAMAIDFTSTPYAYFTNTYTAGQPTPPPANPGSVISCPVLNDGTFGPCVPSLAGLNNPIGIAVNKVGTKAYVVETNDNVVRSCPIINGVITGPCDTSPILPFPFFDDISANDKILYVGNGTTNPVESCTIVGGVVSSCSPEPNSVPGAYNITLNRSNSVSYLLNDNTVFTCLMNKNGTFNSCNAGQSVSALTAGKCTNPSGFSLNYTNNALYFACINLTREIMRCPVLADKTLANCTAERLSGQTVLDAPLGLVISE